MFIDGLMDIIVRAEDFHPRLVAISNDFLTSESLLEHSVTQWIDCSCVIEETLFVLH